MNISFYISILLIVFSSFGDEQLKDFLRSYSFDISLKVIDQNNDPISDEDIFVSQYMHVSNAKELITRNRMNYMYVDSSSVDTYNLKKRSTKISFKNIRSALIILAPDTTKEMHKKRVIKGLWRVGEYQIWEKEDVRYLGGEYVVKLPYLRRTPNIINYGIASKNLDFNKVNRFKYSIDNRGRYLKGVFEPITKETSKESILFEISKSSKQVEIIGEKDKFVLLETDLLWPFFDNAPNFKSSKWKDRVSIRKSDNGITCFFVYSYSLKRYGKMAVRSTSSGDISAYIAFTKEENRQYLSQLTGFGPSWLVKEYDKLRGPDYGIIEFTPIPEWNYPVE